MRGGRSGGSSGGVCFFALYICECYLARHKFLVLSSTYMLQVI